MKGPAVDPIGKWSPNHEDCENVHYADGHTALARNTFAVGGIESKNAAGWGHNNIYTADWEKSGWYDSHRDQATPDKRYLYEADESSGLNKTPTGLCAFRDTVLYAFWR